MAVTYIPGPDTTHLSRMFNELAQISVRYAEDKQKLQDAQDSGILGVVTKISQMSEDDRSNTLRALDSLPPEAAKRLLGVDPKTIGGTYLKADQVQTGPIPVTLKQQRDLLPNMAEPSAAKTTRLAQESTAASTDATKQATKFAATGEARAAAEHEQRTETHDLAMERARIENRKLARQDKTEGIKLLNEYAIVDNKNRTRRMTAPERETFLTALDEGKSLMDATKALGFTNIALPTALEGQAIDMADGLVKFGYDPVEAYEMSKQMLVELPYLGAVTDQENKELLGQVYAAQIAAAQREALEDASGMSAEGASQQRLRSLDVSAAKSAAYTPFVGHKLSALTASPNGKSKIKVAAKDRNGRPVTSIDADFLAALLEPTSMAGATWLAQRGLNPPVGPDDTFHIREVLAAQRKDIKDEAGNVIIPGYDLAEITLNVPDPTPTNPRRTVPQKLTGEEAIVAYISTHRAAIMRAMELAGEGVRPAGAGETGGNKLRTVPAIGGAPSGTPSPAPAGATLTTPPPAQGGQPSASAPVAAAPAPSPFLDMVRKKLDDMKNEETSLKDLINPNRGRHTPGER